MAVCFGGGFHVLTRGVFPVLGSRVVPGPAWRPWRVTDDGTVFDSLHCVLPLATVALAASQALSGNPTLIRTNPMKHATVKCLGATALGAALAAATAGTAAAVTDALKDTAGTVVSDLSLSETADTLPAEGGEVVTTGRDVLTGNKTTSVPLVDDTLAHTSKSTSASGASGLTQPVSNLLGGMPVNPATASGLPAGDLLGSLNVA